MNDCDMNSNTGSITCHIGGGVPRDIVDEFMDLLVSRKDDSRLKTILRDDIVGDYEYIDLVATLAANAEEEMEYFLMDEGYGDDEIQEMLIEDQSIALDYLSLEFSSGLGMLHLLESLGMHDESMEFVDRLSNAMVQTEEYRDVLGEGVIEGLSTLSAFMRDSLSRNEPLSWAPEHVMSACIRKYSSRVF